MIPVLIFIFVPWTQISSDSLNLLMMVYYFLVKFQNADHQFVDVVFSRLLNFCSYCCVF